LERLGAPTRASECDAPYIDTPPVCIGEVDGGVVEKGLYWVYTVGPFTKEVCTGVAPINHVCTYEPLVTPMGYVPCVEQ